MAQEKWKFDLVHSTVGFSVRHLMISRVHGVFKTWNGTLTAPDGNLANAKVEVSIDAASIDTKEAQRDEHLRSADFLDAAKYPNIVFESTSIQKVNAQTFKVIGQLSLHGVTKEVTLDTEYFGAQKDPWGGERMGFSAKTSIVRQDFGLAFNIPLDGGGFMVGDKIEITLDVQAVREVAKAA